MLARVPGCRVIWADDGTPYLLRIYVLRIFRKRWPGVFLHYFFQGDRDRALHNHPWRWARSLILAGGYVEHRRDAQGNVTSRTYRPGDWNVLNGSDFHRVCLLSRGCWSLFIAGERMQTWGFSERPGHFETWQDRDRRLRSERENDAAATLAPSFGADATVS
jgi:hypothetical protein